MTETARQIAEMMNRDDLEWFKRKHLQWTQGKASEEPIGFEEWITREWEQRRGAIKNALLCERYGHSPATQVSDVKALGQTVGKVTDVHATDDGLVYTLKINQDAAERLGLVPTEGVGFKMVAAGEDQESEPEEALENSGSGITPDEFRKTLRKLHPGLGTGRLEGW